MMSSGDDSEGEQPEVEVKEEKVESSDDEQPAGGLDDDSDEQPAGGLDEDSDEPGNDEDAELEEEEEDEEDQPQRKRKKKSSRRAGGGFIDTEANVGDDEEEEEEGYDYLGAKTDEREEAEREAARIDARRGRHRVNDLLHGDVSDIAKGFEERAKRREEFSQQVAGLEQADLLPSVRDPKLYTVPCKLGAEQETVISLMSKAVTMADQAKPLRIKSAFYKPSIRGFVYIEAYREDYVTQACQGIRTLIMYRGKKAVSSEALRLVPTNEMVQVMQASKKSAVLKPGSWVRLKRGMYSGDLAQVVDPDEAGSRALLKIVPRIDIQAIAAKKAAQNNPPQPGQPRKRPRKGARAPQRLFNLDDVSAAGGEVQHSAGRVVIFNGKRYRDGYLYNWTNLDSMNMLNVSPTLEELQMFEDKTNTQDGELGEPGSNPAGGIKALQGMQKRQTVFAKGDVIKVLAGELKNLKGTVTKLSQEGDDQQLVVKPMLEALKHQELVFSSGEVVKFFKLGDHVEVLAGRHEKETGLVVRVDGEFADVFSDINRKEIKVFSSDLKLSAKVATGVDSIGKYLLNDMVMIGTQNVGVIIRIDKESVTVLTNNGVLQEVNHQAIGMKRNSRQAVALDQNQNQIVQGDRCRIDQGADKNKQGVVIHLYRSFVFLHSSEEVKNSGVMVARSRHLALLGGEKKNQGGQWPMFHNPMSVLASPSQGGFGQRGKGGMGGMGGMGGKGGKGKGKGMFGNEILLNKKVLIKCGANKGYQGLVKHVTMNSVNVELVAKRKTVTVRLPQGGKITDVLQMMDEPSMGFGGPGIMAAGSMFKPPDTPAHGDMPRTPAHGSDPLGTPGPADDAWDPDIGQTPARDSTPNWGDHSSAGGPGTPSSYGGSMWNPSPYGDSMSYTGFAKQEMSPGPGTPGTPGYGQTPGTPEVYSGTPGYTPGGWSAAGPPAEDQKAWLQHAKNVLVTLTGGQYAGSQAVIRGNEGMRVTVELVDGGQTIEADANQIEVVAPAKRDNVMVIADPDMGGTGVLIGIDGEDGIVKMSQTLDIKIIQLGSLAKMAG